MIQTLIKSQLQDFSDPLLTNFIKKTSTISHCWIMIKTETQNIIETTTVEPQQNS